MNNAKLIVYWAATALLSFGMLGSGFAQIFQVKDMVELITPLGYHYTSL